MSMPPYSTWLEIDLGAIQNNIQQIQYHTSRPVMAVIKANGYGHGLSEVGRAAVAGGAAWLGVARLGEALALREAGITAPILVLGFCAPEQVPQAIANQVSLAVHDFELVQAFDAHARGAAQVLCVHAKFDTGMGRLGVFPEEGLAFIRQIQACSNLRLEGMFTHLARADEPALDTTGWQLDRFETLLKAVEAAGLRPRWVHAANSAAALYYPHAGFDLVRPGIAIYGLHPSAEAPLPAGFRPALTWKTQIVSIKTLPPGHGIGYNYRYVTRSTERVGTIPVGYADGFRRRLGNVALLGGRRVPVLGGVCMDQCMIRLDEVAEARIGDEVVLLGRQGSTAISAEELGQAWGTNNYEVVCGLTARVPRLYQNS